MTCGNSFREKSICCQILGPLNLIDLFQYWEQTGWQKYWPEVELLVSWVWTELTAVNRRSNVLGILLLWKLCISIAISSWCMSSSFNLGDSLKIQKSEEGHKEGSIHVYCSHEKCCGCSCAITITLWSFANHVEARYNINGKRFHRPHCIRGRWVTGKARDELSKSLKTSSATREYRELLDKCTAEEQCLGALTYLPSQSVLQNIRSENSLSIERTKSWILNLERFRLRLIKNNQTFIRRFSVHPTFISLYTKSQIRLYNDLADKDVIYFDATGSLLRRQKNDEDCQIYTILVRNPQQGRVSLPVASNVTTSHDSFSISHFTEKFHVVQVVECGKAKKPSFRTFDGSAAVWNGVL